MIKLPLTIGALALVIAAAAPAFASAPMTKTAMTKSQMATMTKCKAATKKTAKCAAFMKAHPDAMMSDGAMMAPEGSMMSSDKKK